MNYIVLDLEWNQAMSSKSSVFNRLPIHLGGEIIEIGAVRLDENFNPTDEYSAYVKPVYFKQMHYKVKKITGIDSDELARARLFPEVMEEFCSWCGNDVSFITWGCDDQRILEQNIIIHDLDWDWILEWINLQKIYNLQTGGDKNQKSLSTAMEHFEIVQTRTAHDALGDAYNTALICTHLDMPDGLRKYAKADEILNRRAAEAQNAESTLPEEENSAVSRDSYDGYDSKALAFNDRSISQMLCPYCGVEITPGKWLNQGDQRYMTVAHCGEHGDFLIRLKFKKHSNENKWSVTKLVYAADSEAVDLYKLKLKQAHRRARWHSSRKNHPA